MELRTFSIHAHFYQPPREDPITGLIPQEEGAAPYLNWNERIHAECYRPNANLNNFERISFNVGPTLCNWMANYDQEVCHSIQVQDQLNLRRYGVGNALAQAYNHTILPLDSYEDKVTQVTWGIADFKHRFNRFPQGMWLPETAVDLETLSVLADQGIEFTILAPWQADTAEVDVTEPYRIALPGGRSIIAFFYQQELSSGISFNPGLTIDADHFVQGHLSRYFREDKFKEGIPQIIVLASDGELYGHHQAHRELFLARLVDGASSNLGVQFTFPGLWLKQNKVRQSIGIHECTSWSCHHGVSRWSGSCSCTPGDPGWKAQLRYAFRRLASGLDEIFQRAVEPVIPDPWALRNHYIEVLLGQRTVIDLLHEFAGRELTNDQVVRLHLLLEAQRERMKMFTSCGFFFEDLDRLEPRYAIAYAAQAVRLARMATGVDLTSEVMSDLSRVRSNRSGLRGDHIFSWKMERAVNEGRSILTG